MKKLFTIYLVTSSFIAFSQPTLLSTEMAPQGTVCIYKFLSIVTPLDTTLQGANQVWDFSSLTNSNDPDDTVSIVDLSQAPYLDSFPTANYVLSNNYDRYIYYNLSSGTMARVGENSGSLLNYYPDPMVEYAFPMNSGLTNDDSFSIENSGTTFNGQYIIRCLGYGTLMAPGHTYSNVIMATYQLVFFSDVYTYYVWYDSDNGMQVFGYDPGNTGPPIAAYLNSISIGISENVFAIDVNYNNPVTSILDMKMTFEKPKEISYTLMNILGKEIYSGKLSKNASHQLTLNLEGYTEGLYLMKLINVEGRESVTYKIVKE